MSEEGRKGEEGGGGGKGHPIVKDRSKTDKSSPQ